MNGGIFNVAGLVVAGLLAGATALQSQEAVESADRFRDGSRAERIEILARLATHRTSATTPAELGQLLASALQDPDQTIRKRALSVVASRAGGPRLSGEPGVMTRAKNELPHLIPFRALVLARLADAAAEVREEAVLAIGNLDAAIGGWTGTITLGADTIEAMMAALRVETHAACRARLVEALAVSTNALPKAETWWPDLMGDASPGVRQYAVRGARKLPAPVALPLLIGSLGDPDSGVRLQGAQVIAEFKEAAVGLIPALLDAAERETDPIVQKTLQGTVKLLRDQ